LLTVLSDAVACLCYAPSAIAPAKLKNWVAELVKWVIYFGLIVSQAKKCPNLV